MNTKGMVLVIGIIVFLVLIASAVLAFGNWETASTDNATSTPQVATSTSATTTSPMVDTSGWVVSYSPEDSSDLITVTSPSVGDEITSPLVITGQARGNWFFEAVAPVVLTNWDGLIIAEGYIEAEGEWMTEDFVPFTGTLTFEKPSFGERGFLIIQKDNPSGLPENDAAVEIPILFK